MKILLGLHKPDELDLYKLVINGNDHEAILPQNGDCNTAGLIKLLDNNPNKVLMDVNYGKPGSEDVSAIIQVAEAMRQKGYDISQTLLGVTGRDSLIEFLNSYKIPVVQKPGTNDVFAFLS